MLVIKGPHLSDCIACPYLPGRQARFSQFFAAEVDEEELDRILESGWRKFGLYYFRPACPGCSQCVPLRVPVVAYVPTRSQRKIRRRNEDVEVRFGPVKYSNEIYEVYSEHSRVRFGKTTTREEFEAGFMVPSCPCLQSEFHVDGRLAAVGFLDIARRGLSSVYFAFRPEFSKRGPGVYSILREIAYAAETDRQYYYLGYHVAENQSLSYKNAFGPNQKLDWATGCWTTGNEGKEAR